MHVPLPRREASWETMCRRSSQPTTQPRTPPFTQGSQTIHHLLLTNNKEQSRNPRYHLKPNTEQDHKVARSIQVSFSRSMLGLQLKKLPKTYRVHLRYDVLSCDTNTQSLVRSQVPPIPAPNKAHKSIHILSRTAPEKQVLCNPNTRYSWHPNHWYPNGHPITTTSAHWCISYCNRNRDTT